MSSSRELRPAFYGFCIATLFYGLSSMQLQVRAPDLDPQFSGALTTAQQEILSHMSIVYLPDGLGGQCKTIRFSEVNVQIVNGLGKTVNTDCRGNLIVGYNELGNTNGDDRTGSHNIIVGTGNSYSSYGGLVAGSQNFTTGEYSSVLAGHQNIASGDRAVVVGGELNSAGGYRGTLVGGFVNIVDGSWGTVAGGRENSVAPISDFGTAVGGGGNIVQHDLSLIRGGCVALTTADCESIP